MIKSSVEKVYERLFQTQVIILLGVGHRQVVAMEIVLLVFNSRYSNIIEIEELYFDAVYTDTTFELLGAAPLHFLRLLLAMASNIAN